MVGGSYNQSGYLSVLFVLQPLPEFSLKRIALPAFDMICFRCCCPLKLHFASLGCLWKVSCHRMKAGVWWQIQICLWRVYLRHLITLGWCFPPTFYKCLGASSTRPLTSNFSALHKIQLLKYLTAEMKSIVVVILCCPSMTIKPGVCSSDFWNGKSAVIFHSRDLESVTLRTMLPVLWVPRWSLFPRTTS